MSRGGHISTVTGSLGTNVKRARQMPFGTTDRTRAMILPRTSTKTAIRDRVVGEDRMSLVGGSLQHAPLMDSMSAPASTAPMNSARLAAHHGHLDAETVAASATAASETTT
jgi:hypothetical protein